MIQLILWIAAALLFVLAVAPCLSFLRWGWAARRREILDGLDEVAAQKYFTQFHRKKIAEGSAMTELNNYYVCEFGRKHFVVPLILFSLAVGCGLLWSLVTAFRFLG